MQDLKFLAVILLVIPLVNTTINNDIAMNLQSISSIKGCANANCPHDISPPVNVTFFPHDSNCSKYCMCDWYSSVHAMDCPEGLYWNTELDTCDWPQNVPRCSGDASSSTSSTTASSSVSPNSSSPTPSTTNKPPSLPGGCEHAECPYDISPPSNVTFFPHDSDCSKYCMCDWYSSVHVMDCPEGLYWNTELDTCDWPQNVPRCSGDASSSAPSTTASSSISPGSSSPSPSTTNKPLPLPGGCEHAECPYDISPPANVTSFPHDSDCSKYCMCDWYSSVHVMDCPEGLYWNTELDTCDWPQNVPRCSGDAPSSAPSTTASSSVSPNSSSPAPSTTNKPPSLPGGCEHAECPYDISPPANVTFFPHDSDCSKYCMCDWYSSVHVMDCPEGLYWNTELDTCDWPQNVPRCSGDASSSTSSTTASSLASPDSSSPTPSTTNKPLPLPGGCEHAECPYDISPPANVTFFPHDSDCSKYCMCDWYSSVHVMDCPKGLYWNTELDTCDWPQNVPRCSGDASSTTSSTTASSSASPNSSSPAPSTTNKPPSLPGGCEHAECPNDIPPPANVTFFPHDSDCSKYCMCDWYSSVHVMDCPKGLYWNTELDTCDWPQNVPRCSGDASSSTSSTTANSSVSPNSSSPTPSTTNKPPSFPGGCEHAECPYDISPPSNVTFFPHDSDCSKYCMCDWYSSVHVMDCRKGLYWNTELDTCDWPQNVPRCSGDAYSTTSSTTASSSVSPNSSFPAPSTTNKPPSLPGGCEHAECPYDISPPANVTFFLHDSDCSKYCMCDWYSSVHVMDCPEGLYWNTELGTCDWPQNVPRCSGDASSSTSSTTASSWASPDSSSPTPSTTNKPLPLPGGCEHAECPYDISPPANVTFFPHDSDCSKYCMCDWYSSVHVMDCPKGLYWNTELDTCDWPQNVPRCSGDASSTTSSTTASSSASPNSSSPSPSTTNKPPSLPGGCEHAECPYDISPPANVTFFPHDSDCSKYCMCDWYSSVHVMDCPEGLYWNTELDTCDWPQNVPRCSGDASSSTSSTTASSLASPDSSSPTPSTTNKPLPLPGGCEHAECPYDISPPANVTFFPHDSDCSKYCMCDWYSSVHVMDCPKGLYWNTELDTCDWPQNVPRCSGDASSTTSSTTASSSASPNSSSPSPSTTNKPPSLPGGCEHAECPYDISPPANVTFFPHDSDCSKYCMCDWYSSVHVMDCPEGLYWNTELDTCDWPQNVPRCSGDASSSTSSTTASSWASPDSSSPTPSTTNKPLPLPGGCEHAECPYDISPPANVTFFPHDSDCSKYCMCDWYSSVHVMDCPKGLYWNTELDTCDWPQNVPRCSGDASSTTSSTTASSSASPNSSSPSPSTTNKPPSLPGGCEHAECPYDISPPANVTFFPHDSDCSKYCMCDWYSSVHVMDCPEGLYWNTELDICDWPQNVPRCSGDASTTTSSTTASSSVSPNSSSPAPSTTNKPPSLPGGCEHAECPYDISPPSNVTFFPHDSDCSKYCMCDWYSSVHVMDCPEGLYWNTELDTCDWPQNVPKCSGDASSSAPSTTASSSVSPDSSSPTPSTTNKPLPLPGGCEHAECPYDISPPANVTFFPHDSDCSKYCMCDWYSSVHVMDCPKGLYWNTELDTCDWPQNVPRCSGDAPSSTSSTTASSSVSPNSSSPTPSTTNKPPALPGGCEHAECPYNIFPPANVTFFPHDSDCSKYCMCDWYSSVHVMDCPEGLYWNTELDTCDWPQNMPRCSGDASSTTSSTTASSSVSPNSSSPAPSTTNKPPSLPGGCEHAECPYDISPPSNVTFFPHDSDCSKYCMCDWYSSVHVMDCPEGLYWNTELDTCDWPQNVPKCSGNASSSAPSTTASSSVSPDSSSPAPSTTNKPPSLPGGCEHAECSYDISPPANVTFFSHDSDCSKYCMCDWYNSVHVMDCPKGLYWNTELDTCDWPQNVSRCSGDASSSTSSTTASSSVSSDSSSPTPSTTNKPLPLPGGCERAECPYDISPPANVTFFAHETNCGRYCMCDWYGIVHDMPCPEGLHWNTVLDTCDYPTNVECVG